MGVARQVIGKEICFTLDEASQQDLLDAAADIERGNFFTKEQVLAALKKRRTGARKQSSDPSQRTLRSRSRRA